MTDDLIEDNDFQTCSCPRAAEALKCDECETLIEAGEIYTIIAGRWDGYDYAVTTHMDCHQARRRLNLEADLFGEDQLSIAEHLEATFKEVAELLDRDFPAVSARIITRLSGAVQ